MGKYNTKQPVTNVATYLFYKKGELQIKDLQAKN